MYDIVVVFENAPGLSGNPSEDEWMVERDPARIAQMLNDSSKVVREARERGLLGGERGET